MMELAHTERGPVDILAVLGTIHAEDNEAFAEELGRLRRAERYRLVIDAGGLEYLNSRAVATLVAFSREARLAGGKLVLVRPTRTARKILESVGFLPLVPMFETMEEAVAACGEEAS